MFEEHIKPLQISHELEYLLHSHLLFVLKTTKEILDNGIINTRADLGRLSKLSKQINLIDKHLRSKIVEVSQKKLSILSMEAIRRRAETIEFLEHEDKERLLQMLSDEHTHLYTADNRYEPKVFGCQFYTNKAVIYSLRQEEALICLKSIVPKGEEVSRIYLKPEVRGGEFVRVPENEIQLLNKNEKIVVYEAVIETNTEDYAEQLMIDGFTETILSQAAKTNPYEPGSVIEDIVDREAYEEVKKYQEKTIGNYLILDHVYLNNLGAER